MSDARELQTYASLEGGVPIKLHIPRSPIRIRIQGVPGPEGRQGPKGEQGLQGEAGITILPVDTPINGGFF